MMLFCAPKFDVEKFIKRARRFDAFELRKYDELYAWLLENHKKVVPQKLGLRLFVISDTHGEFAFKKYALEDCLDDVPGFDLCVLLGDIHPYDMPHICDCINKENIVAVKGNHDSFDIYSKWGICDISGKTFDYNGVRFAGIEGSFRYKNENFPSFTQYDSLNHLKYVGPADILISHDCAFKGAGTNATHVGLIGTTYFLFQNQVQWHLHGHLHRSYQREYQNGTKEKCVFKCEYLEL